MPSRPIRTRRYKEDDAFYHEGAVSASWERHRDENPYGDPGTSNNDRAQAWDRGFRDVEMLMDEDGMDGADALEAIRFRLKEINASVPVSQSG